MNCGRVRDQGHRRADGLLGRNHKGHPVFGHHAVQSVQPHAPPRDDLTVAGLPLAANVEPVPAGANFIGRWPSWPD